MYSKIFPINLLKAIDEKELTIESLSQLSGLTREYLSRVVNGKQVPTLTSLEKICSAVEKEPNELLMIAESLSGERAKAMKVNTAYCQHKGNTVCNLPVCPYCNSLLPTDWQSCCDYCGQRLSWEDYVNCKVIMKKPQRKHLRAEEI